MVHFFRMAAGDRNQCCCGIFHNALWVEVWEGTLHKLVDFHECVLFSEYPRHSATEGEEVNHPS